MVVREKPVKVRHAEFAYYATPEEATRIKKFKGARTPHVRPDAVYVIAIGTSWEPESWQKVMDMVAYTNERGFCCWFREVEDSFSQLPYAAVNSMRDYACLTAHNAGFEWVLLVENDILPEPDMLIKLMNWNYPVVVPYCLDDKYGKPLAFPTYKPDLGLQPIEWAVFSCILMKTSVLHCFPESAPFREVLKETSFFKKLVYYGHKGMQDTSTPLKLATRPTFHGDTTDINDLWKFLEGKDKKRREVPNRRAIDPDSTSMVGDVYIPDSMLNAMGGRH